MSNAIVHSYYFTEVGLLLTYSNSSSSSRCCSYADLPRSRDSSALDWLEFIFQRSRSWSRDQGPEVLVLVSSFFKRYWQQHWLLL